MIAPKPEVGTRCQRKPVRWMRDETKNTGPDAKREVCKAVHDGNSGEDGNPKTGPFSGSRKQKAVDFHKDSVVARMEYLWTPCIGPHNSYGVVSHRFKPNPGTLTCRPEIDRDHVGETLAQLGDEIGYKRICRCAF